MVNTTNQIFLSILVWKYVFVLIIILQPCMLTMEKLVDYEYYSDSELQLTNVKIVNICFK